MPQTQTITELNQPSDGPILEITATDIQSVNDPLNDDDIVVGIRFVVENKSKKDFFLGYSLISAYVDDVTADGDTVSVFNDYDKSGEDLHGNIAPRKFAKGYYAVNAPKDAKKIEVRIEVGIKYVSFIFDIPPVKQ